jgi:hypothetical protein
MVTEALFLGVKRPEFAIAAVKKARDVTPCSLECRIKVSVECAQLVLSVWEGDGENRLLQNSGASLPDYAAIISGETVRDPYWITSADRDQLYREGLQLTTVTKSSLRNVGLV